jgi:hypothetical protein
MKLGLEIIAPQDAQEIAREPATTPNELPN